MDQDNVLLKVLSVAQKVVHLVIPNKVRLVVEKHVVRAKKVVMKVNVFANPSFVELENKHNAVTQDQDHRNKPVVLDSIKWHRIVIIMSLNAVQLVELVQKKWVKHVAHTCVAILDKHAQTINVFAKNLIYVVKGNILNVVQVLHLINVAQMAKVVMLIAYQSNLNVVQEVKVAIRQWVKHVVE